MAKKNMMRLVCIAATFVAFVVLVGLLAGCNPLERARDTAQKVGDEARQRAAALDAKLADAQAALDEARALGLEAEARRLAQLAGSIEVEIATAEATATAADAAVAQAEALIAEAEDNEGLLAQVPGLAMLPPPYREGAALAVTIGGFFWRNQKLRGAATSIIKSIEVARKDDPAVDAAIKKHATTMRAVQTGTAQKLVDQVQTKRVPLVAV